MMQDVHEKLNTVLPWQ